MTGPGGDAGSAPRDAHAAVPLDASALRRRVLLAGVVALGAFFVLGYVLTAVGAPPVLLLPTLLAVLVLVVRPLMAPVLQADRERRRRAYASFRADRADREAGGA